MEYTNRNNKTIFQIHYTSSKVFNSKWILNYEKELNFLKFNSRKVSLFNNYIKMSVFLRYIDDNLNIKTIKIFNI